MRDKKEKDVDGLVEQTQKFGHAFLRSFMLRELYPESGEVLQSISESYSQEDAQTIFNSISDIMEGVESVVDRVNAQYDRDIDFEQIKEIRLKLMGQAYEFLQTCRDGQTDQQKLIAKLKQFNTDNLIFTQSFLTVKPKFEEIKNATYYSTETLTADDVSEMREIVQGNYEDKGEIGKTVISKFERLVEEPGRYYIFKRDGKVDAFMKLTQNDEGHYHGEAFNVRPELRGAKLGEAMLRETVIEFSRENVLEAQVRSNLSVGEKYVEEFGCNIVGVEDKKGKEEYGLFNLLADQKRFNNLESRKMTRETILELYEEQKDQPIEKLMKGEVVVVFARNYEEEQAIFESIKKLTDNDFIGTRYFSDKTDKRLRYFVFEKI